MKKCKQGYYYCYKDKKCKKIPSGYRIGLGGWLRKEKDEETEEKEKNGNGNGANGNGNGNGESDGGSNGGGVSEAWSSKYKKSIDCNNPKGFSQRAHCRGRKKMNEASCPICGFDPCQCLEGVITEKRDGKSSKDKGYSLRDWFKGGGWKQTGGKYDGKPCARQPGQKTKPYCRDADDRAAMSKEERNKRARKKRKEDPNPNRKGKAKNVTQESYSNWRKDFEISEQSGYGVIRVGDQTVRLGNQPRRPSMPVRTSMPSRPSVPVRTSTPSPSVSQPVSRPMTTNTSSSSSLMQQPRNVRATGALEKVFDRVPFLGDVSKIVNRYNRKANYANADAATRRMLGLQNSYQPEGDTVSEGDYRHGSYSTGRYRMLDGTLKTPADIDAHIKSKQSGKKPPVQTDKAHYEPEGELVDEGKKDACYHKVKSRYSVWPSAYASGALVKCRKVGAKNWGNKTKKESVDYSNWRDDFQALEIETIDLIKADPIEVPRSTIDIIKEGARKKGQVRVTNVGDTLKKSVDNQIMTDPELQLIKKKIVDLDKAHYEPEGEVLDEKCWKGYEKKGMKTMFGKRYPNCVKKKKTRKEEVDLGEAKNGGDNDPCWDTHKQVGMKKKGGKMVPNCVPKNEEYSNWRDELEEGAAWTKKEGKNKSGGLNEKGRKSYERENPGSDLKRPSKKVGNKRRKSFCARMKGMKKKLTSKKTANDPDSRINKSLRAWNC